MSQNQLSQIIKIKQGTLNYQAHNTFNYIVIFAIAKAFPELSMEWLIRGEGDMLLDSENQYDKDNLIKVLKDTIETYNRFLAQEKSTKN